MIGHLKPGLETSMICFGSRANSVLKRNLYIASGFRFSFFRKSNKGSVKFSVPMISKRFSSNNGVLNFSAKPSLKHNLNIYYRDNI